jgi:restriction modification system DNA specificity domain protein
MNNAKNTTLFPYLERLLEGEKVEWKTLGEICEKVCSGGTPSTATPQYYKGNIPWMRTQDIDWREIHDTEIKITEEAIANSSAKLIPKNCVIVAMYGATAAKACINKIPLTTNQACCNLQIDENLAHYKYVYYWICHEYERLKALGEGSQSNLNVKKIKSYKLPIPPLRVQARIVEILDKFTQLEAELEAELEARRKQYAYYRDQLLNFSQYPPLNVNIKWEMLGEVAEIGTGNSNRQDEAEDGLYPFYVRSKNILRSSTYQFDETAIIIPGEGGIGDIFHYTEGKYALHQRAYRIKVNAENELFPKFLFYYMTNAFKPFILSRCVGATATSIRKPMLTDFPIPLPPLSEQRRIVDILDRFDTLTNSISEGLPKEIALRRKQYAYYRDALLSFPRPEVSA